MSRPGELFSGRSTPELALAGVIGRTAAAVCDLLGSPAVDRLRGADRWLVYRYGEVTLRVRCHRGVPTAIAEAGRFASTSPHHVVFWTATFAQGRPRLREAAQPLGLWPACAPDACPGDVRHGLLRRAVVDPVKGVSHTLTASIQRGLIRQISVFDEAPEWIEPSMKGQV